MFVKTKCSFLVVSPRSSIERIKNLSSESFYPKFGIMFGMDCFYRRERSNTKEKKKKKRKVVTVGELKHTMRCLELFSPIKMIEFTLVITFQGLSRRKCFYFKRFLLYSVQFKWVQS